MKTSIRKRLAGVVLATVLVVGLMTTVAAVDADTDTAIPTLASFSVDSEVGAEVVFTEADFAEHVSGDSELEGIVLTSLPLPSEGVLCVGDRALLVGEAVTTANLSALRFVPADANEGSSRFSFIPVFASGAGSIASVSVAAVAKENHTPAAIDIEFETIKNIALTGEFPATDADGDALTYTIVTEPKKGTVASDESSPNKFVYTPKENKTGTDSFVFTATDPSGATSDPAKVTIKIVKNAAKMTYADMEGNPAHYAALKLAADGVLIGKRIDTGYYFEPETAMTRGEFVALALTCLGIDVDSAATSTGFADDAETASWLRPYIATAARLDIVSGKPTTDGRLVFGASDEITRAEAAVVLANAVGLSVSTSAPAGRLDAVDVAAVPAWAEASMGLVEASGILDLFDDGTLRPMAAVTRADAAGMLYSSKVVREELETSGLLDKAFA